MSCSKPILIKRNLSESIPTLTTSSSTASNFLTTPTSDCTSLPPSPPLSTSDSIFLSSSPPQKFPFIQPRIIKLAQPQVSTATALFVEGRTTCPDSTELVFCPELHRDAWLPKRWTWRHSQVEEFLEQIAATAEESDEDVPITTASKQKRREFSPQTSDSRAAQPIPIARAPTRPATPSISMYSSINGRSVPVISPRSTSHSILASPDDQYNSSDSDPEDYRRRREQSVASILSSGITSDEPSLLAQSNGAPQVTATVTEVDLDSESDPGDILYKPSSHRGKRRTSSSNGKSARPSSLQIPERTHRKMPHQPPPIPNRSTNPPRTTMLKFRSKIRVTGGVKLHRNKPGGRPLITCAADSLKINLSEAWRPDPSRPGSSRQFYLASYSNPSSATSSVASFECSINMHNYIPMFKPRRLVHPPSRTPPPPPRRTPKVCKPKFDWMYQRLLDGVDSDESEWSWPHESSDEESPVEPPIEQRLLHAVTPGTVRLAEWRAREDALVLQAHVSDWRSKVEACEENERRQTDLIAQSEAKRDILDAAQVAFKKPNRKSKSPKLKPALNRAASHDRFVPHSVRYGTRVQVRQVGDEKSEVMKSARALAKGLGLSWGTRDYDEELRTSPPRQSRITRRRSTA